MRDKRARFNPFASLRKYAFQSGIIRKATATTGWRPKVAGIAAEWMNPAQPMGKIIFAIDPETGMEFRMSQFPLLPRVKLLNREHIRKFIRLNAG